MKEQSMLDMVKTLQQHWGCLPDDPQITYDELSGTYSQLVEELDEWGDILDDSHHHHCNQITQEHIKDFRDVSVDLIFYILQSVVRTGQSEVFMEDFKKIYENNMTKVVHDPKVLEETLDMYHQKGVDVYAEKVMPYGHWVVKRQGDNKIMKPSNFRSVEL